MRIQLFSYFLVLIALIISVGIVIKKNLPSSNVSIDKINNVEISSKNNVRSLSAKNRSEDLPKLRPKSLQELAKMELNEILEQLSKAKVASAVGDEEMQLLIEISRRMDIEPGAKADLFNEYLGDDRVENATAAYVNAIDEILWKDRTAKNALEFLSRLKGSSLKNHAYAALFDKYIKNADDLKVMLPHIVGFQEFHSQSIDASISNRLARIVRKMLTLNMAKPDEIRAVIMENPPSEMTRYLLNENLKRRNVDIQF